MSGIASGLNKIIISFIESKKLHNAYKTFLNIEYILSREILILDLLWYRLIKMSFKIHIILERRVKATFTDYLSCKCTWMSLRFLIYQQNYTPDAPSRIFISPENYSHTLYV